MPGGHGQLTKWACCQICGEVTPRSKARGWLISPYRPDPTIDVVRCPRHISEWALRRSEAGRTKQMRAMMKRGKLKPPPRISPENSPMPLHDRSTSENHFQMC